MSKKRLKVFLLFPLTLIICLMTSVFWKENQPLDTNAKPNVLTTYSSQIELKIYFSQSKDQDFQKKIC
jgi:hypothetical protein